MLSKIIAEEKIVKTKDLIYDAENIAIIAHSNPDGDAVGSALALYHFFFSIDKKTTVIFPDRYPAFLGWMHGANKSLIYTEQPETVNAVFEDVELIICVDFNEPKRAGGLKDLITNSKAKKILVDHHPNPLINSWDVVISYPQIASTSEMVFRLVCRMGYASEINKYCAECIYTGMMTDTGKFTFNSNNHEIYYIIGELIRKGINKDDIYHKVYNNYSANRMKLMGHLLANKMYILKEYKTSLMILSLEDQDKYDFQIGDSEGFVNLPLSIDGVIFSAFLKEDKNRIKVSLRSQGSFPVNEICEKYFNGGGHVNAAGGEVSLSLEDAVSLFNKILPEYNDLLNK